MGAVGSASRLVQRRLLLSAKFYNPPSRQLKRVSFELAQELAHSPPSPAGLSRGSRLGRHGANLSGIAGTSPAMTPNVWLDSSGTRFSLRRTRRFVRRTPAISAPLVRPAANRRRP